MSSIQSLALLPSERGTQGGSSRVHATQRAEARFFAQQIVRDPLYRQNLLLACQKRTVAPAVEIRLMEYAWGKPTEHIEIGEPGDFGALEDLSAEDLALRAEALAAALRRGAGADADVPESATLCASTDAALAQADTFRAARVARESGR